MWASTGVSPRLAASNLIVGIAVALLVFGYATLYGRTHVLAWVAPLLGAWLVVAPWVVLRGAHRPTEMVWSNVITGGCIVLLGLSITGLARIRPSVHRRQ